MIGWLYLFINFPLVVFCKIGITKGKPSKRARQVDRAMPGVPVPIFAVLLPFPAFFESILHNICRPVRAAWLYKGDGHTEVFWIPAGVVALVFMCAVWVAYAWVILAGLLGAEAATELIF
jgi:hypothetical protein